MPVWTKNGKCYRITEDGGKFYVTKPGHGGIGQSTLQGAIAIVEAHAGSKVRSIG